MFDILRQSLRTGVVTTSFPDSPPAVSPGARCHLEIDFAAWRDARPAAGVCPTAAITCADRASVRTVEVDLGKCVFCGLCAEVEPALRLTNLSTLAVTAREKLKATAHYRLTGEGAQGELISAAKAGERASLGAQLKASISQIFGRSLHVRQVDAGSCNGCEVEIHGLNSPIYDAERFGIHFVASPRHADMLLVTGPVTRNMELALRKTYDAMPEPRLVVAVGACGCSGGIFGRNYATVGGVDSVLPVDVYIPGCPPNPYALLHGILLAVGRWRPDGHQPEL
jgi:Ni,Fe-hydrogenase III small subunit/formate hydrogenlyase subunit 6/NADH:ubiquinone oxidoreductase subunit I